MQDRIEKLPRWAKQYITDLKGERDIAVRKLHQYLDSQTPSGIYYDELICDGESRGPTLARCYINGTNNVTLSHAGVELVAMLVPNGIELRYAGEKQLCCDVAMIPKSYQQLMLTTKDNMH